MLENKQNRLSEAQVEAFFNTEFEQDQISDFESLFEDKKFDSNDVIVDVGGGVGRFAKLLTERRENTVRVLDIDENSISSLKNVGAHNIEALVADALNPPMFGDEKVVTINLILHHLVGQSEEVTRGLQKSALKVWRGKTDFIFINEYIYESFIGNLSGRLIYYITSSAALSLVGSFVSKFVPSLRANTFGVGVRFRSHSEWLELFEQCGFRVTDCRYGESEFISLPRRILFISGIKRNSYLLRAFDD